MFVPKGPLINPDDIYTTNFSMLYKTHDLLVNDDVAFFTTETPIPQQNLVNNSIESIVALLQAYGLAQPNIWNQQGSKLIGSNYVLNPEQGYSVSLTADGNTAVVGGPGDDTNLGAAWVFIRDTTGVWSQQVWSDGITTTYKLFTLDYVGVPKQGYSVSISGDSSTIAVGGPEDDGNIGAVWIYIKRGTTWVQQGVTLGFATIQDLTYTAKTSGVSGASITYVNLASASPPIPDVTVVGSDITVTFATGVPTALQVQTAIQNSYAANSLVSVVVSGVPGNLQTSPVGFTSLSNGLVKIIGSGAVGTARQGYSVNLSYDGNVLALGGPDDNGGIGATWVFIRSGTAWSQVDVKIVAVDNIGFSAQGTSVSTFDYYTNYIVAIGGPGDDNTNGAVWIFKWDGVGWNNIVKLIASDGYLSSLGQSVSLSANGTTLVAGGPSNYIGGTWVFNRTDVLSDAWVQQGSRLVGTAEVGASSQGSSVSISYDGNKLVTGGPTNNNGIGAAWIFTRSGVVWSQQGTRITGSGFDNSPYEGSSACIAADGKTIILGGFGDNDNIGAAWIFIS